MQFYNTRSVHPKCWKLGSEIVKLFILVLDTAVSLDKSREHSLTS